MKIEEAREKIRKIKKLGGYWQIITIMAILRSVVREYGIIEVKKLIDEFDLYKTYGISEDQLK